MLVGMNELGFDRGYRGTSKDKGHMGDVSYNQYEGERRGR